MECEDDVSAQEGPHLLALDCVTISYLKLHALEKSQLIDKR